MCVCACVCLVWVEESETSCMGFVCMLGAELGQCQLCLGSNLVPRWPKPEQPVCQQLPIYVETSVYGIHACMYMYLLIYPQIHVNISLGTIV